MSPSRSRPGGRLRRTLIALALLALALGVLGFFQVGAFLTKQDALSKADAIIVLAGSLMDRPLEGADLYLEGFASTIILTYETPERSAISLKERGIPFQLDAERSREAMVGAGVPRDAILIPERIHDNTAQEAQTLRELAVRYRWRRVIVVTSNFHLRRAGFAVRRELRGTGVEVIMRGSRYDKVNPSRWWASRRDIRWMLSEVPKFAAYVLGLGA